MIIILVFPLSVDGSDNNNNYRKYACMITYAEIKK